MKYPLYRLGWHMLLDLAARVQDLLQFKFDSFKRDSSGGSSHHWIMKKT
jgi:hypothetical protein